MNHVIAPPTTPSIAVHGKSERFPVRRIYCVGRNYAEHAIEMGGTGREAPFFFMKPADAVLPVEAGAIGAMPYPSLTKNLHHEVELVVAIGQGGRDIPAAEALRHVWGYAVGLDMTRRDLQNDMKKAGRPWDIGKGFEASAPIGPLTPAAQVPGIHRAPIVLDVNGTVRQVSHIDRMIWSVAEIIEHLSAAWTLAPGDLIYTGTPEGVAAVVAGDLLEARVEGLEPLRVRITD
ncbi:fumarylacetoacetate hydrolase family protein [Methylibium sp.]|uniref:fumarylacetoacetate hydrolase family protein n=1 Tax=Methylibium sp. TaxID=2067992 RepID=UPI003D0A7598